MSHPHKLTETEIKQLVVLLEKFRLVTGKDGLPWLSHREREVVAVNVKWVREHGYHVMDMDI